MFVDLKRLLMFASYVCFIRQKNQEKEKEKKKKEEKEEVRHV